MYTFKFEILQSKEIISSWVWITPLSYLSLHNLTTSFPMIMRTDENFNVIWSALFDISNTAMDKPMTLTEDDIVYAATLNNFNYGCIMALSFEEGTHILSKCYQYLPVSSVENNDITNLISNLVSFNETYFIMDFMNDDSDYSLLAFGNLVILILSKLLLYSL